MANRNSVSLLGAIGIGIGGMVGGGIFAVLGLSISLSGGGAPLAFAIAGAIAMITSYSYGKLSVVYPSSGDPSFDRCGSLRVGFYWIIGAAMAIEYTRRDLCVRNHSHSFCHRNFFQASREKCKK